MIAVIIDSILSPQARMSIDGLLKTTIGKKDREDFLLRVVMEADFKIINIASRPMGKDDKRIEFEHNYDRGRFSMPIESESAGALSFVEKMDLLYDMIKSGKFLMIDELDDSLHHDIMTYFIQTFLSNESEAQLLFTVHDQLILTEDFMCRDMVRFTDKEKSTAATEVFSADDFNLHKNASIFNAYKLGKLGVRPQVGLPFLSINPNAQ